ncbi:MAG: SpoIIE family protein phosphatase [Verrucomicrobiae bacterium]|nr:SpoIIE family protein phosphatase [Verrucomicrobiae bacterium]
MRLSPSQLEPRSPDEDRASPLLLDRFGAPEILDALADGIYITDRDRKIVFWSKAASRITGWRAEDVVGHACHENILNHIDLDGHALCGKEFCPLHRAIMTGACSTASIIVSARHRDGHRIPVEVSVAPIKDPSGQILGGIEVFRDLTQFVDDLRRARIIQDGTLSCPLPDDPRVAFDVRYTPEQIIGGDFYRIERAGDDGYAIMVADVMGHGPAAALFTMQLRSLWEECRAALGSPAEFMTALNARLHRLVSADGYFATAILLILDAGTGAVRYVRAGHPAGIIVHADGQIATLEQRGPALGLLPDTAFTQAEARLLPGDSLLLFTDGAVEVSDASGEELGEERFIQLLRREIQRDGRIATETLEQRLLEFAGGLRLADDLTLILARWSGSPSAPAPLSGTPL